MSQNFDVIILAAGKGTRMKSQKPKVLHQLCGLSLLERTLRAIAPLKPQSVIIVAGYGLEQVETELNALRVKTPFADLPLRTAIQEKQGGTGDAARVGVMHLSAESERILIVPGDSPLLDTATLRELLDQGAGADLAVLTADVETPHGYGRVVRDASKNRLERIVEERDCTPEEKNIREINVSLYAGSREFFANTLPKLKPNNAQGELYLTDIVQLAENVKVVPVKAPSLNAVLGANSRYELSQLEEKERARINREHMENGVTLEDPRATYIDTDVSIGADTFIGAGTRLRGATSIGSNVVIEGDTLVDSSVIADGVRIRLGCYIQNARIGARTTIGPSAHLRPGSVLHEDVKIGNYVETKAAELHSGVKANHLAYLGDIEVGSNANIGAGTIICNYDGVNKHRTFIGKNSFVGSNSVLIAPVRVEEEAYVAAGSAINKDVPSGSLAIARGKQEIKVGWMARKLRKDKVAKE